MLRLLRISAIVLAFLFTAALSAQTAQTTPSRLTAPIDASSRAPLANPVHPLATRANDRGALPASTPLPRLQLLLKRSPAQEDDLRQLLDDLHTPGSASFHQWLTPEQFGNRFGPSEADAAALTTWLASQGFTGAKFLPGRQVLEFSGTAAQFHKAFGAEIHQYTTTAGLRNASSAMPSIPSALAPVVGSFVKLNNFTPRAPHSIRGKATYDPATGKSKPSWTIGSPSTGYFFPLAPADFAVQYDTAPLIAAGTNGAGQTIAVINISNVNAYFVQTYRSLFSLPASPLQVIVDGADPGIDGINSPDGSGIGWAGEAYLDVEMTGMAAPGATIDLVIASDTALSDAFSLASEHAVYNNLAPIMSLSVEECEIGLGGSNAFYNTLWQQAAAQGITVVVAASDSGSAGCDNFDTQSYATDGQQVNGFASTPYNIAVGGTDFYYSNYAVGGNALANQVADYWTETASNNTPNQTLKSFIPEQPWNNSQFGLDADNYYNDYGATSIVAGSGGASNCATGSSTTCAGYAKPAWQAGTGVPADKVRDLPDVSLFAANGQNYSYYPICDSDGDCQPVTAGSTVQIDGAGGTSASAPAFAGIMALVNQKYGRQGQANYVLYPLATQYPAAFHDVTVGTNTVPCNIATTPSGEKPMNCIAVTNPITVVDQNTGSGSVTEGEIGSGTTAEYKAGVGYDLASGLGSVDANVMIADWNKVAFASTTTTLTPSSTSFAHGTNVTLSGKVTGTVATPTGQVALMTTSTLTNNKSETDFTLASGSFSEALNYLPGGTYTVYGRYAGDTANAASTSTPVSITVTPESSATALQLDANGSVLAANANISYGMPLSLEAIPAPTALLTSVVNCLTYGTSCTTYTAPTGSVTFTETGVTLPTVQLTTSGEGYDTYLPTVGTHTISAAYSGDASYGPSTSGSGTVIIAKDYPQMSATEAYYGPSFDPGPNKTISFLVSNSNYYTGANVVAPTGTLTFKGGPSTMPASATLVSSINPSNNAAAGIATVLLPATTAPGNYTVSYTYPGDANYAGNTGTYALTVIASAGATSTITATAPSSVSTPAAGVNINVTVTGNTTKGTPTGYIFLYSGGTFYNYYTLPAGSGASVSTVINASNYLFAGNNVVTVEYVSFNGYAPSETTVTVNNSIADFTLLPTSSSLTTTTTATESINLTSTGYFTGAVSLTCAATGGITCSFSPASATLTANGLATSMLTVNASSATSGTYSAVITAADSTGQYVHTATLTINVPAVVTAPGLKLTSAGNITLATPGSSGFTTLTLTPSGSLAGSVVLSCAITSSPGNSTDLPSCTVTSPVTVALNTTASATLSVNSTAPHLRIGLGAISLFGACFAFSIGLLALTPLRRRLRLSLLAILLAAAGLTTLSGCGGGASGTTPSGPTDPGTTLGAYTVTVTATGSGVTTTAPVTVTVN